MNFINTLTNSTFKVNNLCAKNIYCTMINSLQNGGKPMQELLRLENISKTYQAKNGETEAVKNVSFSIDNGEFVSLIGPSRVWQIHDIIYNSRLRKKLGRESLHRR